MIIWLSIFYFMNIIICFFLFQNRPDHTSIIWIGSQGDSIIFMRGSFWLTHAFCSLHSREIQNPSSFRLHIQSPQDPLFSFLKSIIVCFVSGNPPTVRSEGPSELVFPMLLYRITSWMSSPKYPLVLMNYSLP